MPMFKDYNAELFALKQRQRELRHKHVQQLGDLVVATHADTLDPAVLAGALLAAVDSDKMTREVWRNAGARFLEYSRARTRRKAASREDRAGANATGANPSDAKADPN